MHIFLHHFWQCAVDTVGHYVSISCPLSSQHVCACKCEVYMQHGLDLSIESASGRCHLKLVIRVPHLNACHLLLNGQPAVIRAVRCCY